MKTLKLLSIVVSLFFISTFTFSLPNLVFSGNAPVGNETKEKKEGTKESPKESPKEGEKKKEIGC